MANGKNRLFWLTSLAISSIPLAVTFYAIYRDKRWLTILSFTVFVIFLLLSTCTFLSWKTFKFSTPIILYLLRGTSATLSPLVNVVRGIPVLGKVTNGCVKVFFWASFIVLMSSDVLVRKVLKSLVGLHEPSAGQYSTVNACDTNFQPCGEFGRVLDEEKVKRIEEGGRDFEQDHDESQVAKSRSTVSKRGSKGRHKSLDLKWMTPGKAGSDLSTMSDEDWALALKMANIDKSRFDGGENLAQDPTKPSIPRPRYSQPIATTLAMLTKLVYEDVPIIRHELSLSGYDLNSFRAVAYRNTYGFIVQKGRNIVLVFRGTDPLNLQNAWTDIQSRLVAIETTQDPPTPLGKCHQGMYNALGKSDNFTLPSEELAKQQQELSRHHGLSDVDAYGEGYPSRFNDSHPAFRSHVSPASSFRSEASRSNTLNLELSSHSIYHTIATSLSAAWILIKFLLSGLFTHVSDPVDYRFAGENRDLGAFAQASRWVDGLRLEHAEKEYRKSKASEFRRLTSSNGLGSLQIQDSENREGIDKQDSGLKQRRGIASRESSSKQSTSGMSRAQGGFAGRGSDHKDSLHSDDSWKDIGNAILDIYNSQSRSERDGNVRRKRLRFYVCGHSLGGGLATIFLGKMVQCNSPLLDIFAGLYTYGQPRIGDKDFSRAFGPNLACKMFHHVHNNDIFPRVPFWGTYETPPGTLVFMDTARKLTLYPPDPVTLMPVPVRGISFIHLSGIMNPQVIMRMRNESWLRIVERIFLPFFLNDHFPGDYVKALAEGTIEVVVHDSALYGGVDERETGKALQTGYFSQLSQKKRPAPIKSTAGLITSDEAPQGPATDKPVSRRWSYAGYGKRVSHTTADLLSGDNDSGYGADSRAEDMDPSRRIRRGIVKYTYHGDEDEDDDDDEDDGYYDDTVDSSSTRRNT
ncbi:hypothetical protein B0O80DRAFT_397848 [Mortierella sp. GBAus27b]|nr:hypothetical protein BGX31_009064 [Mortierella sp. GBA43]KAI8360060.1 hypothetical protein B0O80DRAFT_397848 [Mortierella sp. GBAus27b]